MEVRVARLLDAIFARTCVFDTSKLTRRRVGRQTWPLAMRSASAAHAQEGDPSPNKAGVTVGERTGAEEDRVGGVVSPRPRKKRLERFPPKSLRKLSRSKAGTKPRAVARFARLSGFWGSARGESRGACGWGGPGAATWQGMGSRWRMGHTTWGVDVNLGQDTWMPRASHASMDVPRQAQGNPGMVHVRMQNP